jgi:transcriptional regulator with XRE-family HTH domain
MDRSAGGVTGVDRRLGERLRRVRVQQDRSLHDVERDSRGVIKASVLGAYERGERSVSLPRLRQLAEFYRLPVEQLLPPSGAPAPSTATAVVIDLVALEERRDAVPRLARYADGIRTRRGDHQGRVLTVRGSDLEVLAAAEGTTAQDLRARLETAGVLRC